MQKNTILMCYTQEKLSSYMHIQFLTLGKLKESYWRDAEAEYLKRLTPYAKIEIKQLKEESFSGSDKRDVVIKKEAEKLLESWPKDGLVIALHERGKHMTSPELADFLQTQTSHGEHITFIIGGPLGLHESVLTKCDHQLSLSNLTFPHQMVRTVLLEQLYRSVMIGKGKYHY